MIIIKVLSPEITFYNKYAISKKITSVETAIKLTEDNINLFATKTELTQLTNSKETLYSWMSKISLSLQDITLSVSDSAYETIDGVLKAISEAEASIKLNSDNIALKVDKDGIVSSINQSPESVSINANKINLHGIVTANENFKILEDGSMVAKNGTFSGTLASADGTFSGNLSAATGTFSGELLAASGTFTGELQAATGTFSGSVTADSGYIGGIDGWTISKNTITGNVNSKIVSGILQSANFIENVSGVQMNLNTGIIKGNIEASSFVAQKSISIYYNDRKQEIVKGIFGNIYLSSLLIGTNLDNVSDDLADVIEKSNWPVIKMQKFEKSSDSEIEIFSQMLTCNGTILSYTDVACGIDGNIISLKNTYSLVKQVYTGLSNGRINFYWNDSTGKITVTVDNVVVRTDW